MHHHGPLHRAAGFTLNELLVTLAAIGILAGISVPLLDRAITDARASAGQRVVQGELQFARETALTTRREVEIVLRQPNQVRVVRVEPSATDVVLRDVTLEHGVRFLQFPGQGGTPENPGSASAIDFGGASRLLFSTDGSLTDEAGLPVNGSIYLGIASKPETARALTVFGPTGRVAAYRWTGSTWQ